MTAQPHIVRFDVTNTRTNRTTSFKTRGAMEKAMSRQDQEYGACCTTYRAVWSDQV